MEKKSIILIFIFLTIISLLNVRALDFDYVIANSENWQDVYSIIHYSNLVGVGNDFLVGTKHGSMLISGINKNNDIRVISSRDSAFILGYDDYIRDNGFKDADEQIVNNANLELISELPEINNFIIVGSTYGYNAIAAAPYAVLNRAWVFFADRSNIDEIDAILSQRNPDEVVLYGSLDREVKDQLEKYNPVVIDNNDRFKDNVEIFKKYESIKPVKQVALTNGEFIEKEVMSGLEPVLFTGKENVPDQIRDFIKESNIEVGVLIGADLVGAATNIRRSTGISVIVKFARGARAPAGSIASVEGIDLFYVPAPVMELELYSAKFNKATSQLEITYKSNSNVPVFLKGTVNLKDDQNKNTRIGDVEPIFIAPNSYKTVVYPDVEFSGNKLTVDIFTLYGETKNSLEKILEKSIDVEIVNVIDNCQLTINEIKYSKSRKLIYVQVENEGNNDCWAEAEITDITIDGVKKTVSSENSIQIKKGKKNGLIIKQEMTDEDLEKNPVVDVVVYYGEREDNLLKIIRGKLELKVEIISYAVIGMGVLGLIALMSIIMLIIFIKRRKEKDEW